MPKPNRAVRTSRIAAAATQNMLAEMKVSTNLQQEIIITTEDKVRLCLLQHLSRMDRKKAWFTPLGILLTITIVFPTASFHDFLGLNAETRHAMFIIGAVLCLGWLGLSLPGALGSASIDQVVADIKRISGPESG